MTESRGSPLGLLVTAVLAIFVPPIGFAVSFAKVVKLRHDPHEQRQWAWVMAVAWVGLVLLAIFYAPG